MSHYKEVVQVHEGEETENVVDSVALFFTDPPYNTWSNKTPVKSDHDRMIVVKRASMSVPFPTTASLGVILELNKWGYL